MYITILYFSKDDVKRIYNLFLGLTHFIKGQHINKTQEIHFWGLFVKFKIAISSCIRGVKLPLDGILEMYGHVFHQFEEKVCTQYLLK